MPERDGYIPGVPCWVDTSQPDPEAAASFYGGLFGWEFENVMPAGSVDKYLIARIRGGDVAAVGSLPEGAPGAMWNTYVWVDSADETAAKVADAGGAVLAEPFDVMAFGRMGVLSDPGAAAFCVWEARRHRGARIVNEPGSFVFNGLNTRDVEVARSFYGAVFGWRTIAMPGGGEAWTLPGYGDHLESKNPGLREHMAAMGAPAGFEDVVAAVTLIGDEQPNVSAHWSVTFAVDDPVAAAEKATELGGSVLVPPFDAPWVRMAVLADPAGATFIVSKFVPENKDLAGQSESTGGTA
jgi:predicted enzyme related to lactoylglutathione lyase